MKEREDDETKPLAQWANIAEPASLATRTGTLRFAVTIKLPEKSFKTASSFVQEMNDALKAKIAATPACTLKAHFDLVDSERTRMQRATANFATFKDGRTCLRFLKDLGLPTNDISAELETYGKKQYDPWYESISQSWWPWLATLRNPAPEMPMMKITSRLDLTEGSKYKEGASGKLGKSDEVDRADARADADDEPREEPKRRKKARDEDEPDPGKKRRKKE